MPCSRHSSATGVPAPVVEGWGQSTSGPDLYLLLADFSGSTSLRVGAGLRRQWRLAQHLSGSPLQWHRGEPPVPRSYGRQLIGL